MVNLSVKELTSRRKKNSSGLNPILVPVDGFDNVLPHPESPLHPAVHQNNGRPSAHRVVKDLSLHPWSSRHSAPEDRAIALTESVPSVPPVSPPGGRTVGLQHAGADPG